MRQILTMVLLLGFVSTARADDTARKMAEALKKLLTDYETQVDKKVKAEQDAYQAAAKLYASAQDEQTFQSLTTDRLSMAMSATAYLIDGKTAVDEFLFDELPAYARQDFDRTKTVFAEQSDSYRTFLTGLQSLTAEKTNAQALAAALGAMSKKSKLSDVLGGLKTYGDSVAKQLKSSDCALSVARLSIYTGQQTQLTAKLQAAGDDEKKRLQNDLNAVNQQIASIQAERDATGLYDATKQSCQPAQ